MAPPSPSSSPPSHLHSFCFRNAGSLSVLSLCAYQIGCILRSLHQYTPSRILPLKVLVIILFSSARSQHGLSSPLLECALYPHSCSILRMSLFYFFYFRKFSKAVWLCFAAMKRPLDTSVTTWCKPQLQTTAQWSLCWESLLSQPSRFETFLLNWWNPLPLSPAAQRI